MIGTTHSRTLRPPRSRPRFRGLLASLAVAAGLALPSALAQGAGSGEYGDVPLDGSVDGTIAGVSGEDTVVYHTYTVTVPPGTASLTVTIEGFGSDLDVAVNVGRPIVDYNDVDHLDISEDPDPVFVIDSPPAGTLYVDVLNLLPQAARYRMSVSGGGAAGAGPATPAPGAHPPAPRGNPLAPAADPLVGVFEGDGLRVTVAGGGGAYSGELVLGGQSYAFEATGGGDRIEGSFVDAGSSYPFTATLSGDVLTVESGGARYRTQRLSGTSAAAAVPRADDAPSASTDAVLARGAYGVLTRDDATAFVEALEFSLRQSGFSARFSDAEREQMLEAIAASYGTLGPSDQAVLAQAREVWTRVQSNWASASEADRREFVLGVFVLAFGEEAVQRASAGGGGGGGAAGGDPSCATIDDCMSAYADPETYQDSMNAQSCWAAAGCSDYDPADNSFSYDTYDTYDNY